MSYIEMTPAGQQLIMLVTIPIIWWTWDVGATIRS